jgi:hypothetical protein
MKKEKIEKIEEREDLKENDQNEDDTNFIQEYIEKKKLQNRVLREIIENFKQSDKK